jgi:hypothetical protein
MPNSHAEQRRRDQLSRKRIPQTRRERGASEVYTKNNLSRVAESFSQEMVRMFKKEVAVAKMLNEAAKIKVDAGGRQIRVIVLGDRPTIRNQSRNCRFPRFLLPPLPRLLRLSLLP